ncbi:MAG: DUF983 domain-containing protein [Planctomycetaceae bacterium]
MFPKARRWFAMHERCDGCGLKYERAPGYFLGSAYINYGWIGMLLLLLYPTLHFGLGFTNRQLLIPLAVVFVGGPILLFRHARSAWLAMDCVFDRVGFAEDGWDENHGDVESRREP